LLLKTVLGEARDMSPFAAAPAPWDPLMPDPLAAPRSEDAAPALEAGPPGLGCAR